MHGVGAFLRNPPGHALRDALRAGQGDVHALRRQGALGRSAASQPAIAAILARRLPDGALLGAELGERAGGSDGQQAGDGPGALHLPGPGLQAPDPDAHGQGLPLREPGSHLHACKSASTIARCGPGPARSPSASSSSGPARSPTSFAKRRTETRNQQVVTCELRQVERTVQYTVMVPHTVQKKVQVQVCRMVEKTVQVPVCQPCCPHELLPAGCCCGG